MRFFSFRWSGLALQLFRHAQLVGGRSAQRMSRFSFAALGIGRRPLAAHAASPRRQSAVASAQADAAPGSREPESGRRGRRFARRHEAPRRSRQRWSRPLRAGESLERRAVLAAQNFAGFGLDLLAVDDTGTSATDRVTSVALPTVKTSSLDGLAITAGSQIEILRGGAVVGSYTVSAGDLAGGIWAVGGKEIQLSTSLQEGLNSLTFRNREGAAVGTASTTPLVVTLDTSSPAAGAPTLAGTSGIRRPGDVISFDVVFPEPVYVTGNPQLVIAVGTSGFAGGPVTRPAGYASGNGTNTLRFSYEVLGDVSNDVDGIGYALPLVLPFGASIGDLAGNAASLGSGSGTLTGVTVLTTASTLTMTTLNNPNGGTNGEARATPVPVVDLEFSAPVALGTGAGFLEMADFELTRDGAVVHGRQTAWPAFVALTQGVENPRRFQISNLSQITEPSGTYILTFSDAAIGESRSITWVKTGPTPAELTAVMAVSPTGVSPRTSPVDAVRVTFQDVTNAAVSVVGVTIDDFTFSRDGGPDLLAAAVAAGTVSLSGSGNTYVINGLASLQRDAVTGDPIEGSYRLALPAGAVTGIVTLANGQLLAPVDIGWTYNLEPTVSSVTVTTPPGTLAAGAAIEITVRFSKPVTVTGQPTIPLLVGTATRQAAFNPASNGTDTLRFSYTVVTGDEDRDGILFAPIGGTTRYEILGGAIVDAAGAAARREFLPPVTSGILVDADRPAVIPLGVTGPLFGHYVTGDVLSFRVSFDEAVVVSGDVRLQFLINGASRTATLSAASLVAAGAAPASPFLEFEYEVASTDFTSPAASSLIAQGIQLFGGTIRDVQGNEADLTPFTVVSFPLTVNRIAPTVSVNPAATPATAYRAGDFIYFNVSYGVAGTPRSVTVTGFPSFTFQIGSRAVTATYIGGSPSSTLVFRGQVLAGDSAPAGITIVDPTISGGTILAEGTGGAVASLFVLDGATDLSLVTVDAVAPRLVPESVSLPAAQPYGTGDSLVFTVDFDEPVLVTGSPRLSFTLGTAAGAPTRQAVLTPASAALAATAPGTTRLEFEYSVGSTDSSNSGVRVTGLALAGGTITDLAGNAAVPASLAPLSVASDQFAVNATGIDEVTIASGTYPTGSEIIFVVKFSAAVNASGAQLPFLMGTTTANASLLSGSGTDTLRFRHVVAAGNSAPDGILLVGNAIVGGSITAIGGTPAALGFAPPDNLDEVIVDGVAPRAFAVNGPTPGTYVTQTPGQEVLQFTVLIDDTVNVVAAVNPTLQFSLGTNTRQAVFAGFGFGDETGTALLFEYEVQPGDSGQSVSIPVNPIRLNGATIRDAAGNNADLSGIGGGGPTQGVIVNQTTVQIQTEDGESGVRLQDPATQDDRYYRAGETILLEVSFTAPVTVTGSPSLRLAFDHAGGTGNREATYVSGSGTDTLLFAYTVRVGDFDPDGLQFALSSIQLNGGTITNAGGNALLSFVPPVITGVRVDAATPQLASVGVPAAGRYRTGDLLQFEVRFNESMLVDDTGGTPYLALVIGSTTRQAEFVAGNQTPVLIFEYEVQEGDLDTNGIVLSTAIQLAGGKITDLAGNTGSLFFPAQTTSGIVVDGVEPTLVRISSSTPSGRYTVDAPIAVSVTLSETVRGGSFLELDLTSGGTVRVETPIDSTTLTGTYIVAGGENTPPGDRLDVDAVITNGVADLAGNPLDTTLPAAANLIAATRNIVIDTVAPTVVGFTSTTPAGDYGIGATINVRAEVSEDVRIGSSFTVTLNIGTPMPLTVTLTRTAVATILSGSFTVVAGQNTTALQVTGYTAGTLLDVAGNAFNPLALDVPAGENIGDSVLIGIDTTAPTIVSFGTSSMAGDGTGLSGIFIAGDEISLTATASEEVRDGSFVLVTLDTGAVVRMEALAVGDQLEGTYTVPAAPPGHATAALNVVSFTTGNVRDLVGNVLVNTAVPAGGNIADTTTLVVDSVPPVLTSITSDLAALRKGQTAVVTFTFSEPVLGFTSLDISASRGTISQPQNFPANQFLFTPDDNFEGSAVISVAASRFTDAAGNSNVAGNTLSLPVDTLAPTLTISDNVPGTATGPVTFTFRFPEAVTGFTADDVTVTNGTKAAAVTRVNDAEYTLVVTPAANTEGELTVSVPAGAATDLAGNASGAASATQAIDTLAPTVTITDNVPGTANGPITFTFEFSEPVTGFTADDVAVFNGTKNPATFTEETPSRRYTLVVTPAANTDGTLTVSVPAGAALDVAGNPSVASSATQAIDTVAPTLEITDDATATTNGLVTFTFRFSEPVTGFTADDVTVTNGTKAPAVNQVSASVYTLVVTPAPNTEGELTVSVPAGAATDLAGNPSIAASATQAIDTRAPTVIITDDVPGTATGPVTFTFEFSEPVTGFTASSVVVTNGTKAPAVTQVTARYYTLVVTPTANTEGTLTVTVPAGVAADALGNPSIAASATQAFDTLAPTVTIADDVAGIATGPVTFTFTFSEAVTGFTADDVTVTNGTKGTFTAVSGSVYTLVVTPAANTDGVLTVSVPARAATDLAGNASGAASATQAIDTLAPTVTITDNVPGTATGPVTFTFKFSEAVTGFTADDVTVTNGTRAAAVTRVNDSEYTLVVTPDANTEGTLTVSVAAGAALDLAGNPSVAASATQAIDTFAPTVIITDNAAGTATGPVTFTFRFSEPVTGFTADDVTVTNGTKSPLLTVVSASVYTLVITPTAGFEGEMVVSVAAAAATDAAGNPSAAASATQTVDTRAPTLVIGSGNSATATGPVTFTFTFSEAVTGFTADDVTVTTGTRGTFTAVSGSVYTLVVTPPAGAEGSLTVAVAAGAAEDVVGNKSAAASATQAFDTLAPTLAIANGATGTATGPVTFTFTFSEAVSGFTAADVTVTNGTKGTFTAVSGAVYTLVVTPPAGAEGSLTVAVAAGAAGDAAGNPSAAASLTKAFDTLAPTVVSITGSRSGTLTIGSSVVITATLSEPVQVGGTVTALLNTGARVVLRVTADGRTATGTYVVAAGQSASPLNVVALTPDGSLRDLAGNALTTTLPPAAGDNLGDRNNIVVNGAIGVLAPAGFSTDPATAPGIRTSVTRIRITFNTPVTGVSLSAFRLFLNGRSVTLRGAQLQGRGSEYSLVLPASLTRQFGTYNLRIGPQGSIRAANGVALTQATNLYWRRIR